MEVLMTPVLPVGLTEPDEIPLGAVPFDPPQPFCADSITQWRASPSDSEGDACSFSVALQALLEAHEAEILVLKKEVGRLRCERDAVRQDLQQTRLSIRSFDHLSEAGEHSRPLAMPPIAEINSARESSLIKTHEKAKPAWQSLSSDHTLSEKLSPAYHSLASEHTLHTLPDILPEVLQSQAQVTFCTTEEAPGILSRQSTLQVPSASKKVTSWNNLKSVSSASLNSSPVVDRLDTLTTAAGGQSLCLGAQSLCLTQRPSALHHMSFHYIENKLYAPWEDNWIKIVSSLYMFANQRTCWLHDCWRLPENYVGCKLEQKYGFNVDLWQSVCTRKKAMKRNMRYDNFSTSMRPSRFVVTEENPASRFRESINLFHEHGLREFIETYIVMSPHRLTRLVWVAIGMALIFYDVIILPLQSFDVKEDGGFLNFMKWFQAIYWVFDFVLTFFTAVYVDTELVRSLRAIAINYARTWLAFDIFVLVPIWVELLFMVDSDTGDSQAVKILRIMRFCRLIRIAKFTHLLDEQLKTLQAPYLILVSKLVQLVLALILFTHVNACLWYHVGNQEDGWVLLVADADLGYKYLSAVHWALTQFQGTSEINPGRSMGERLYAVIAVLISLIIACLYVSNLTNIIVQIQSLTAERDKNVWETCEYMRAHNLPRSLSTSVRNFLEWKSKTDKRKPCEVLKCLPEHVVMEIEFEIYKPTIIHHDFLGEFTRVYPRLCRQIFHDSLHPVYMSPADSLFCADDSSNAAYFVVSGLLDYAVILRRQDEVFVLDREPVGPDITISEPALWMQWQHKGTCVAETYSQMLVLNAEHWRGMIPSHPKALLSCQLYARRLLAGMARCYWRCSDIIVPAHIIKYEEEKHDWEALLEKGKKLAQQARNEKSARPNKSGFLQSWSKKFSMVSGMSDTSSVSD